MSNFNERFDGHMANHSPEVSQQLQAMVRRSMGSLSLEAVTNILDVLQPQPTANEAQLRLAA